MSDDAKPKKKKGKLGRMLLVGGGGVVLLGGGVGAGLFFSGAMGGAAHAGAPAVDPNKPQLVPRKDAHGDDEPGYETSYYPLEKEFTSNLKDSVHFVQAGLAIATDYDSRVIANVEKHQMAIRSAVLMTLGDTDEEQVFTPAGKEQLQARLAASINKVLEEKAGFGGVGNVYFTNFIVQ